ncbi:MAG: molybdenum cofactor biosynthesis protein B [Pyrinomonadaceae bacterium]
MREDTIRAVVITVSDTRDDSDDASGEALTGLLLEFGAEVMGKTIVHDERGEIETLLCKFADSGEIDLVITSGGTGLAPRDVTPEATLAVIEREAPGIADALRRETAQFTPMSMLARGVCGTRKNCLIINFPGAPKAVRQCFEIIRPILRHAIEQLRGGRRGHEN